MATSHPSTGPDSGPVPDPVPSPGSGTAGRPLRKDAERNRQRILDAARQVFAEQGVHAPVEEIARRAEVGIGTLYRRFPDRAELVEGVFLVRVREYLAAAQEALRDEDAWRGFQRYLEELCAMQAADRSVTEVLSLTLPASPLLERLRMRVHATQNRLIRKAQRQGALRTDLVAEDILLILVANAALVQATGDIAPEGWRRLLGLTLDGLRTGPATELPAPPSAHQLVRALARPAVNRRRPAVEP